MSHFEYNHIVEPKAQQLSIRDLFQQTFGDSESHEEGERIGLLSHNLIEQTPARDIYVFVATDKKDAATGIIGCIMFTRLLFVDYPKITAFLLSPVAVHTAHQGKGIGRGLLNFGVEALRSTNSVDLVVTYGDPKYYSRVGFQRVTTDLIPSPLPLTQPQGWQAQSFRGRKMKRITGKSTCVPAFNKPEYW